MSNLTNLSKINRNDNRQMIADSTKIPWTRICPPRFHPAVCTVLFQKQLIIENIFHKVRPAYKAAVYLLPASLIFNRPFTSRMPEVLVEVSDGDYPPASCQLQ